MTTGGAHLPIAEVLEALQTEFPDVTVTKIRFLESQGLIEPERTPSGYRKFYAEDVSRLRWILAEQRDHGSSLQELKARLAEFGPDGPPEVAPLADAPAPTPAATSPTAPTKTASGATTAVAAPTTSAAGATTAVAAPTTSASGATTAVAAPTTSAPTTSAPTTSASTTSASTTTPSTAASAPTSATASTAPASTTATASDPGAPATGTAGARASRSDPGPARRPVPPSQLPPPGSAPATPADPPPTPEEVVESMTARRRTRDLTLPLALDGEPAPDDDGPDSYDRVALARAADVTEATLDELEKFGVIAPFYDDGIQAFFDRDALVCVQAAVRLQAHGIEPRHLKMYVHFTEREAALFQQVLAPFLRQKNPVSRGKVEATLNELVGEARALRGALLRRAVDGLVGD